MPLIHSLNIKIGAFKQTHPYTEKNQKSEINPFMDLPYYTEKLNNSQWSRKEKPERDTILSEGSVPQPNSNILDSFSLMMTNVIKALPG